MLRRNLRSDFVGGAYVFPGGRVDDHDRTPTSSRCARRRDADACAISGVESGGLAFWVAAIRESFEEAGVLLAYDGDGPRATTPSSRSRRRRPGTGWPPCGWRSTPGRGACRRLPAEGLRLAADRVLLRPLDHPRARPRATTPGSSWPPRPPARCRSTTTARWSPTCGSVPATRWPAKAGEFEMIFPTVRTLDALERFDTADELMAAAAAVGGSPPCCPAWWTTSGASASCCRATPATTKPSASRPTGAGAGQTPSEVGTIVRTIGADGRAERPTERGGLPSSRPSPPRARSARGALGARCPPHRPQPGHHDRPGHQHLPGGHRRDRGRRSRSRRRGPPRRHRRLGGGRIRWIVVTHTHPDHSPGAAASRPRTGAEVLASRRPRRLRDRRRESATASSSGPGLPLQAIHTPGHASNHLCFLLEEERMLFSGDHVMQGSTVVIARPTGT